MALRDNGLFTRCDAPLAGTAMGACYINHTAGPGVDTGVLIEFEGTLFLSNEAIKDLAEVAGMNVNEEGEQLEIENAHLQREVERLTAERDELSNQLDEVSLVFARRVQK